MDQTIKTGDGSITCYSEAYGEHFHSLSGAATEAREKFTVPALITTDIIKRPTIAVLDIGFGLGYNAAAAYTAVRTEAPAAHLSLDSIERDAATLAMAQRLHLNDPVAATLIASLSEAHFYSGNNTDALLYIGDARSVVQTLDRLYDAIFLDAFSTKKNTELWTYDLFLRLKDRLLPHGVIVTYSAAYPVISAFMKAGFIVKQTKPVGRTTGGTIASLTDYAAFHPIDAVRDNERLATTGVLCYRDETLTASAADIGARYESEKKALIASGVSSIKRYRKRLSSGGLDDGS
ncbi:MAG: MnmC family methyltransferase [Spirochaetota bacterium]